jgi:lipid-binding SYLF domain-containing protein
MTINKTRTVSLLALMILIGLAPRLAAAGEETGPGTERVGKAIEVIQEMATLDELGLPSKILRECHGIAVIPGVIKAAWGIGGQYGRGIVCVRNAEGSWSAPAFISLVGGSLGWQIGVEKADIILVFKTRKSIDNIAKGKFTLGADASIAAGPVGRNAEASTDIDLNAEIFSYSKSKGLFAGVSVKGSSIKIDKDANAAFYGEKRVPARRILYGQDLRTPGVVDDLRKALEKITSRKD